MSECATTLVPIYGWVEDPSPAWNAGAISVPEMVGSGAYSFGVPCGTAGAIVGLVTSNPATSPGAVKYGLMFLNGYVAVIESGILKTAFRSYGCLASFEIRRFAGVVSYVEDGEVFYTSAVESKGTVYLGASLYVDGDRIVDEAFLAAEGAEIVFDELILEGEALSTWVGIEGVIDLAAQAEGAAAVYLEAPLLLDLTSGEVVYEIEAPFILDVVSWSVWITVDADLLLDVEARTESVSGIVGELTLDGSGVVLWTPTFTEATGLIYLEVACSSHELLPSGIEAELLLDVQASEDEVYWVEGVINLSAFAYGAPIAGINNFRVRLVLSGSGGEGILVLRETAGLSVRAVPSLTFPAFDRTTWTEIQTAVLETKSTIGSSATLTDALGAAFPLRFVDTLSIAPAGTISVQYVLRLAETLRMLDVLSSQSETIASLLDGWGLTDRVKPRLTFPLADGPAFTTLAELNQLAVQRLAEALGISPQAALTLELTARLLEQAVAADVADLVHAMSAAETATLADQLTRAIWVDLTGRETLTLADATQRTLTAVFQADEALDLDDGAVSIAEVLLAARETLAFIGLLPLAEGDYQAWVINTDSLGVTQYAQFPFDALATHAGRTYGLTATGLYELTGDTDDGEPIAAWIKTGDLTLGGTRRSSVPRAYLYVRQDGDLMLKTTTTDKGHRATHWYRLTPSTVSGDDVATRRVRLGRGVRAVSWAFEIANVDGADFDLRGCEVLPVVLTRRI